MPLISADLSRMPAADTTLRALVAGAVEDMRVREQRTPVKALRALVEQVPPVVPVDLCADTVRIIAEVKRASPSAGVLAPIDDPAALARRYQEGGAAVVSVLTEQRRFQGALADLVAVRQQVRLPLLRKDFIVSSYQVLEARAHGADLVLLIVAALDDDSLAQLHGEATELGMQVLVEVHDERELGRALAVGAQIVGVNARDLTDLTVDPATTHRLLPQIPGDVMAVAESGLSDRAQVEQVAALGADAILVGQALVQDGDPTATLRDWSTIVVDRKGRHQR